MKNSNKLSVNEAVIFAMLGALMFCSKIVMELLPNIHLIGALTMIYTIVYHKKALYPIYIFVLITGLYGGFALWWIPYLYTWTILWGITMLLPKNIKDSRAAVIYPLVCGLHGLLYGVLYAPAQALMFGLDFDGMITWIVAGFPFDLLHAGGNLVAGFLVLPLVKVLKKLEHR